MFITGVLLAIQVALFVIMLAGFQEYFVYFYAICIVLSLLVVLYIVNDRSNPGYKIAWIILVLIVPVFGGLFYLLVSGSLMNRRVHKKMHVVEERIKAAAKADKEIIKELSYISEDAANEARYISRYAYSPLHKNTYTEYLPMGEIKFQKLIEELKKAEKFIFMEYFIIEEGIMWNSILEVLKEKASQGVDVRLIYDDMGCIMTLPYGYNRKLEAMGIKCCIFNPFKPVISSILNNRDHRKICVIDGHIGFTGGINLADEYINAYEKHGHWKDAALLIKGPAVWNLTSMFLSMWEYIKGVEEDYDLYKPEEEKLKAINSQGFVQPYCDNPLDNEPVGETVYLNLINKAKRYVYINTPYLIIDNEMVTSLCIAAKSGIDVRIVTPHIEDKWYAHMVTRAYYPVLLESGVKIYEYTPGFIHAKTFVVDDEYGVVGTVNLDYRSLYLHFECGAWLYKTESVLQIKEDYIKTLELCQEISLEECRKISLPVRFLRALLRVFAPLM